MQRILKQYMTFDVWVELGDASLVKIKCATKKWSSRMAVP